MATKEKGDCGGIKTLPIKKPAKRKTQTKKKG